MQDPAAGKTALSTRANLVLGLTAAPGHVHHPRVKIQVWTVTLQKRGGLQQEAQMQIYFNSDNFFFPSHPMTPQGLESSSYFLPQGERHGHLF